MLVFASRAGNCLRVLTSLHHICHRVLFILLVLTGAVAADPALPRRFLEPHSAAESWNVIRLVTRNVEQLIDEKRPEEIATQISYCAPALRALPLQVPRAEATQAVDEQIKRAFISVNAIASSAQQGNLAGAGAALASLRNILNGVAGNFDPRAVNAEIYLCPMHSDMVAEDLKTPCTKCGMSLLPRRIAYSSVYTKPGEPTMRMTAKASGPIEAGKKIEVTVRLEKADKSPALYTDLLEMHTEKIHLLIEEPGLGDYHHEHPVVTETPGEYLFSFTPRKTTPYRIWADIVPAATSVQELPFADLPSAAAAGTLTDTADRFTSSAGGYHFTLSFNNAAPLPVKAGQPRPIYVAVADADGKPVLTLEPVMNAFSHLVGFYDDYRTVVHIHPTGGDVLDPALRGGPSLGFMFFPPRAGFIRLYCQVKIGDQMLFAPFNVNVEP